MTFLDSTSVLLFVCVTGLISSHIQYTITKSFLNQEPESEHRFIISEDPKGILTQRHSLSVYEGTMYLCVLIEVHFSTLTPSEIPLRTPLRVKIYGCFLSVITESPRDLSVSSTGPEGFLF